MTDGSLQTLQMTSSGVQLATSSMQSTPRGQQRQTSHPAGLPLPCIFRRRIQRTCLAVPVSAWKRPQGTCTAPASAAHNVRTDLIFAAVECHHIIGAGLAMVGRSISKYMIRLALSALAGGAHSPAWQKCGDQRAWQVRAVAAMREPTSRGFHLPCPARRKNAQPVERGTLIVAIGVAAAAESRSVCRVFGPNARKSPPCSL